MWGNFWERVRTDLLFGLVISNIANWPPGIVLAVLHPSIVCNSFIPFKGSRGCCWSQSGASCLWEYTLDKSPAHRRAIAAPTAHWGGTVSFSRTLRLGSGELGFEPVIFRSLDDQLYLLSYSHPILAVLNNTFIFFLFARQTVIWIETHGSCIAWLGEVIKL